MQYDFRFLTGEEAATQDDSRYWYPVRNILRAGDSIALFEYLTERLNHMSPAELSKPLKILDRLREAVHVKPVIAFYEETSQDIDRVLDVFIRTNSGGMTLSRSDMLMSIATAHWKGDARSEINGAVRRINDPHVGEFGFSRDFLLKAGLMLAGIRSVAFRVTNFTIKNIELLNDQWDRITDSVYAAARLVRDFGFSQSTLTSHSAVLPVAHYLHPRSGHPESQKDAKKIREWLIRSLLKRGIWGSGLDTLLVRLRAVIDEHGGDGFPAAKIEEEMTRRGKGLAFAPEELQDLAESKDRAFALLSTLYPFVDTQHNQFHIDHIFPKSRFTWRRLKDAGVPEDDIPQFQDRADRLPNLQLLAGRPNQEKSATLPREWLDRLGPENAAEHRQLHDLGEVPADITDFTEFYEARRDRLLGRLGTLLGTRIDVTEEAPVAAHETLDQAPIDHEAVRQACARRVERALNCKLTDSGRVGFASEDGETAIVCLVSREYKRPSGTRYWFSFYPSRYDELQQAKSGYVALGCGSPDSVLLIPLGDFEPLVAKMHRTDRDTAMSHWHIDLRREHDRLILQQLEGSQDIDLTPYLI